jgi:putative transposase
MNTTSHSPLPEELIAQLSEHCKTKDDLDGIMKMMWQSLLNQALETEMDLHLGYKKHDSQGRGTENRRNGRTSKTLQGELGPIEIKTPRDRNSYFEPQIVPKHKRRFEGFDNKILALYAKGMTTRDIQQTLEELYEVEVSPALISQVTEAVQDEVRQWQVRPLDEVVFVAQDNSAGGQWKLRVMRRSGRDPGRRSYRRRTGVDS